jgi:hypothetical protein
MLCHPYRVWYGLPFLSYNNIIPLGLNAIAISSFTFLYADSHIHFYHQGHCISPSLPFSVIIVFDPQY